MGTNFFGQDLLQFDFIFYIKPIYSYDYHTYCVGILFYFKAANIINLKIVVIVMVYLSLYGFVCIYVLTDILS